MSGSTAIKTNIQYIYIYMYSYIFIYYIQVYLLVIFRCSGAGNCHYKLGLAKASDEEIDCFLLKLQQQQLGCIARMADK